jgi:hypothetical protein
MGLKMFDNLWSDILIMFTVLVELSFKRLSNPKASITGWSL